MTLTEPQRVPGTDIPLVPFDPMGGTYRVAGDSMAMYDRLREEYPGVFRSTVGPRGFWVLTKCAWQRDAYQNPAVFSNTAPGWYDPEPSYMWIPEMLDPPEHTKWRQLLSPFFAPKRMAAMETKVRERCVTLMDKLVARGECDYVADFSQKYPTSIFLDLMGVPDDNLEQFMRWEDDILHTAPTEEGMKVSADAMNAVVAMFAEVIAERRGSPRGDDLISEALTWQIEGRPIPEEDLLSLCLLMFMAGLDTVTNMLAYSTWHLATHPDDRRRIVEDPELIRSAVEEFLRYYAIVTPGRNVLSDIDFHGCPMKKGDIVSLPLAAATRDPDEFPQADQVLIDRVDNNHIAFGAGPHPCLGSHLARRELRIAMEEWHTRIPDYRLAPDAEVPEYIGVQIGMKSLPIVWDVH
jgi:cytochrome P450